MVNKLSKLAEQTFFKGYFFWFPKSAPIDTVFLAEHIEQRYRLTKKLLKILQDNPQPRQTLQQTPSKSAVYYDRILYLFSRSGVHQFIAKTAYCLDQVCTALRIQDSS
jgi:hypothetical protein